MTKKSNNRKKLFGAIFSVLTLCLALMTGVLINASPVYAISQEVNDLTNLDFSYNGNTSSVYNSPTGWQKGIPTENTTSGAVNRKYFSENTYNLPENKVPHTNEGFDDYFLMINSKTSLTGSTPKVQYYKTSEQLELKPYSTYQIKVYVLVTSEARASVYLTGLEDELAFEGISAEEAGFDKESNLPSDDKIEYPWRDYNFYISTGMNTENVNLELWLGSKPQNASNGAVFFDNVEVNQISENDVKTSPRTIYKNLDTNETYENFENGLSKWSKINEMEENTYAEILNLTDANDSNAKGISYVKTDNSANNTKAFALYTKEKNEEPTKSYFGYKSEAIKLEMYDIIKISANVKVADLTGSAYIKFVEQEVKDANGNVLKSITPVTESISITSNSTNIFNNNYQTCTFYIKGRSLYETYFNIELWLGSDSNKSSGLVVFDNIKMEPISFEDYSNIKTDSFNVKKELEQDPATYDIKNSAFNIVEKAEKELTYPLIPSEWKHEAENKDDIYFGVVNTYSKVYEATKKYFGNFANPGNPYSNEDVSTTTNNILLMQNFNQTYQSVTSSEFSISNNSYYKLSFDYNVLATTAQKDLFNIYLIDDANNTLYADENIKGTNGWSNYSIYFNTKAYSNKLKLILSLGTEENLVKGITYIDNVTISKQENMTAEQYAEIAQSNNVLDFQEGNFNLVKYDKDGLYIPLRYDAKLEEGSSNSGTALDVAFGGIIDASDTKDAYDIEKQENSSNVLDYILMIQTMDKATYSFTAKDSLNLSTDSYYKFTIDVKTQGFDKSEQSEENMYGASFELAGLDKKIEGIVAEEWETYTIYVSSTDSTNVNIKFALTSTNDLTSGIAYFDNYTYTVIEKDEYNTALLNEKENENILFVGDTDTKEEETPETDSSNIDATAFWFIIPTLLLAIALVLALVVYFMKKFKIKKWEKKKVNSYDRDKTVHRDVVRVEAEAKRDANVKEVKARIQELENEKIRMEESHEKLVKDSRANRQKGITKSTEKEFKQYAKMHTAIENRIASLNSQVDSMNTPEYLLSLQHKLIIEKAKKERENLEKAYNKDKAKKKNKRK